MDKHVVARADVTSNITGIGISFPIMTGTTFISNRSTSIGGAYGATNYATDRRILIVLSVTSFVKENEVAFVM